MPVKKNEQIAGNKGLANLGNTCYMNSAIQCLSHLLEFHPKNDDFIQHLNQSDELYRSWYNTQIHLWSTLGENIVVPTTFLKKFMSCCNQKDISFHNFNQNDTEEFINIFMNLLHESVKVRADISVEGTPTNQIERLQVKSVKSWSDFFKNDYSYIIQKFYSQQLTITSCSKCDYYTVNFEPFMVLSLEIPDHNSTLYDCFSSYTSKTTLDADNLWTCDKCKQKVSPDKKIKLWKTSNVIIILLKRYSNRSKKDNFVEYPLQLDLDDYLVDYEKKGKTYSLSGICIQSGSLGGGHYYAMCKNELDGKWRQYNDTNVSDVAESELLRQNPYCLFYRRS
jgi:ubiquitin carboxyl-terminal hydrolase 8